MTLQGDAYLKCIDPNCGLEYQITNTNVQCEKGHLLDVKYKVFGIPGWSRRKTIQTISYDKSFGIHWNY